MRSTVFGLGLAVSALVFVACAKSDDGAGPNGGSGGSNSGGAGGGGGSVGDGGLTWFTTCGDPVCRTEDAHREMPDVRPCTTQQAGQPCTTKDDLCDPQSACNEALRCSDHDPKMQTGGCPISSRRWKADIAYLTAHDRQEIAEQVARFKLARYKYKDDPAGHPHLGFILEDAPDSPAADLDRERVDLYAYLSMVVASLQTQRQTLQAQTREIEALRSEIRRMQRPHATSPR
jgi:hypothetical protein